MQAYHVVHMQAYYAVSPQANHAASTQANHVLREMVQAKARCCGKPEGA